MKPNILVSSKKSTNGRYVIGTRGKAFHADEVVACSIVALLHFEEAIEIVRSENPSDFLGADLVIGIGGGPYDYHTLKEKKTRKNFTTPSSLSSSLNGVPYASSGLIWKQFGNDLLNQLSQTLYHKDLNKLALKLCFDRMDERVMQKVDAEEHGIYTALHTFSYIPSFCPVYPSNVSMEEAFLEALSVSMSILKHQIVQLLSHYKGYES